MNKAVYKHLLQTYGRNPALWVGYFCAFLNAFIIRVYIMVIMAKVTSYIATNETASAKRNTLYFLIAYIIGSLVGTLGEITSLKAEIREYEKLTSTYHKKLTKKDMSFYRDHQTGYLATLFRQHLDSAMLLVRFWRGDALGTLLSLTLPAIILLAVAPNIGLVALVVVLIQLAYIIWSSSRVNKYRELTHEIYRKITAEVSDEVTNIVAFKSGGVEATVHRSIREYAQQEASLYWMKRKGIALLDMPRGIITAFGVSATVYMIINGAGSSSFNSLGLIVLTVTYMFQIMRNVSALPELIVNHDDLVTKLYPTLQYLSNEYEDIHDPKTPQELTITKAVINITDVDFSYPSHSRKGVDIPVFKRLNIHIAAGEQLGVVGLSGAGKSTLANLLLRFDDVRAGSIKIDGIDIRDVAQTELRQNIAYVPQEPLLFHRSIRENIAYYNDSASDAEVIQAAKAAHAHEFIEKLPDGYNTTVGERGIKLSGGQKQRIAIARAVLKKAPIILFDEATSALDSESEEIIQKALPEILGKQTALVVAHRLSTVAGLDRIIVMHDGKVIESGTHHELLALKGRYYSLWQKQTTSKR